MSSNPGSDEFRIFAIDIGLYNMGMASVVVTHRTKETHIEKLDWRPLIPRGDPITISPIVAAVGRYLDIIVTPDPLNPRKFHTDSTGKIIPNLILIEQQHVSMKAGTNIHALEIQAALLARLAERYPHVLVKSVGASARKGKGMTKESKKLRAGSIGRAFAQAESERYLKFLFDLGEEDQHTCDALTMILDEIDYQYLPDLHQYATALEPTPAAKSRKKK